jgi:CRP/FNR family transcriptional regulator, anaerobic regulatory protein
MKDGAAAKVMDHAKTPQRPAAVQQTCDPVACRYCGIYNLCLPLGLGGGDLTLLDSVVRRKAVFKRGQLFFRQGKRFDYIYAIRSGSVKSYLCTGDGRTQITAFHIAGDVLGLSALAGREYTCDARALETTSVCMVDAAQFEELAKGIPSLQYQMLTIMSKQIRHDEELMLLLGKRSAEEKLAGYLLGLSRRYASRNYSPTEFHLSMSRGDIGNYLGIAEETVCRVLARFREEKLITTYRRHTRLNDIKRLSAMADASCGRRADVPMPARSSAPARLPS